MSFCFCCVKFWSGCCVWYSDFLSYRSRSFIIFVSPSFCCHDITSGKAEPLLSTALTIHCPLILIPFSADVHDCWLLSSVMFHLISGNCQHHIHHFIACYWSGFIGSFIIVYYSCCPDCYSLPLGCILKFAFIGCLLPVYGPGGKVLSVFNNDIVTSEWKYEYWSCRSGDLKSSFPQPQTLALYESEATKSVLQGNLKSLLQSD
jgi:hypothetical protein